MIVDKEPSIRTGLRNPKTIHHGGDEILIFQEGSFLDHHEPLIALTTTFMSEELGWSRENALATMQKGLRLSDAVLRDERLVPSVEVFKRDGGVVGVSAQRLILLNSPASGGEIPFLQHLLRAFMSDYRGGGRGTFAVQQAQIIHPEAEFYGHRTQAAAGVRANQRSEIFRPGRYFPVDGLYNTDPVMQELMVVYYIHARYDKNGEVDWTTGVSQDDFPQPNSSCLPPEGHPDTQKLFEWMQTDLGMRFPGKDVLHGVGELK